MYVSSSTEHNIPFLFDKHMVMKVRWIKCFLLMGPIRALRSL